MNFPQALPLNTSAVYAAFGYPPSAQGGPGMPALEETTRTLEANARPQWIYKSFPLDQNATLPGTGISLAGSAIRAHLAGCDTVILLALTLGPAIDMQIRRAEAVDMQGAVLLDTAASVYIEQYAELSQAILAGDAAEKHRYLTTRFSPGYADFPIQIQPDLVRLLDAGRAIGLTVSESGILLPRKSITALLGTSTRPLSQNPPGCNQCRLKEECNLYKEGKSCAKTNF